MELAKRCIQFLDASPEPFHVIKTVVTRLSSQGFLPLDEGDLWKEGGLLKAGGKYYFTRNGSSLVAFVIGGRYQAGNGFKVLGAHTDSPNLRVKPKSKKSSSGMIQLNVETYGGGLWHTWFDRDLSLAGRVILRSGDKFSHRLVKIDRPILRIPNLCIHLQSAKEREAFSVNKQDHLAPILTAEVAANLSHTEGTEGKKADVWRSAQQPELLTLVAGELGCSVEEIADFELSLYDTQGAAVSGMSGEFLCSSRLDNLASCFTALEALEYHAAECCAGDEDVSVVALFDHEEVGSQSAAGAGSTLIADAIDRIGHALGGPDMEVNRAARQRSFILSVDQAHAIHPNYASKHDRTLAPVMNGGIVIKTNNNQRYTTNGVTGFFVRELGRRSGVPIQEFAVRNDCPCGSTIGPMLSTSTGIRAVDLGMPQLSMHSIREMMGVADLQHGVDLFKAYFRDFREVEGAIKIDPTVPL
eukprot:CAMPEP_0173169664 /NCGR_PEP_ID=MMETSP1141-20130122/830_1 /TAXON_ID=483371 /ORGANISM="non described non described, Strain CCMP2298" /LENGTH=470 /DNA_ID=CAMNT_0014091517 /DNA_START=6 /DNA_END=1418 /DNA_ORIENTATION=-